jgi:hypothetical protein
LPSIVLTPPIIIYHIVTCNFEEWFVWLHFQHPFWRYIANQTQWIGRTVMVKDNDVESAMRVLNGIMANEGMFQRWMLTRRQVPEAHS